MRNKITEITFHPIQNPAYSSRESVDNQSCFQQEEEEDESEEEENEPVTKKGKKSQVIDIAFETKINKKLSPLDKLVADMKKKEGNKKPGNLFRISNGGIHK